MPTREMQSVLITGGAGFIGSHLADAMMSDGAGVHVFDNFSAGTESNIKSWLNNPSFTLVRGDLSRASELRKLGSSKYQTVFHLAANPEVRVGITNPKIHFLQNVVATQNLLEYLRKTGNIPNIVFASTSTIYGEPTKLPTPENYSPLKAISVYGATKLASEALISGYAHTYGFKAIIYRLANVVGPRSRHGVIHDFIQKLNRNPKELEILGDGTQNKSYVYISDCVQALLTGLEKSTDPVEIYNVGSEDQINVKTIAKIVVEEMGLRDVKFKFTRGVDGGRGWKGDVKCMLLDAGKIMMLGWKPKLNSAQAIRTTIRENIRNKK